jgi:putative MATE family efflux protein
LEGKDMNNKEFLGTAPVGGLLFKLALPTVAAQLINMLYNIVDRIFIGHIPEIGDLALTGVGVCLPIIMIVSAVASLVGSGGAPRASIAMGEKKTEDAEKILGNCFFLQIIVSVILTAALLIFNRPLLLAFGASENTIEYACDYMNIYAIGTIFVQLTLGMNAFVTAQGYSKIAMLSVVIGAIANLSLDPLFIYGFGMGVKGAALATVISQSLSTAWVVLFLFSKKALLRLKVSNMKLSPRVILPCLGLGLATFMMQASESVISVAFNSSLLEYGGDIAVGAMTILSSVMQFAMLPMNGIAQGAQPILSYNYGAKNAARVKKTYRLLLIACLIYSVSLWSTIMLFPRFLPSIFTPDAALIDFTAGVIRIYFGGLIIFGAQIACQMTFVSLGKALSSVTVAVVRKFVLLLPLIYLVPQFMSDKALGVYTAEPIADVIAVSFTVILFAFQFKKAMEKIK